MGLSRNSYVYSGGPQHFPVSVALGYTTKSEIETYVTGETDGLGGIVYRAFTWIDDSTINIIDPIPIGSTVIVQRTVPKDALYTNFKNNGAASRENIDREFRHAFMAVHEVIDGRNAEGDNWVDKAAASAASAKASATQAEAVLDVIETFGQGTPIYNTKAALQAADLSLLADIPERVVIAEDMPYIAVKSLSEPEHPGKIKSLDGTWYEIRTPTVRDSFLSSVANRNSYLWENELFCGASYSRVIHPAGGLKISWFMKDATAFTVTTTEFRAAIDKLRTTTAYAALDLEGRSVCIDDTIEINDSGISLFNKPKTIRNGLILIATSFPQTVDGVPMVPANVKPAFRLVSSKIVDGVEVQDGTLQQWILESIVIQCNSLCAGIFIDGTYNSVRVKNCQLNNPRFFGIKTNPNFFGGGSGGDLRVEFCNILGSAQASITPSLRTTTGIYAGKADGDAKILGNRLTYMHTGIFGDIGSFLIQGNHIWQGPQGTGPFSDYTYTMRIGHRANAVIVGNYIDNGMMQFEEEIYGGTPSGSAIEMGWCQIHSNIFTVAENAASYNFIRIKPKGASRNLANMLITGNQFRSLGSVNELITEPFKVISTNGSIAVNSTGRNMQIKDNYFWPNVKPQSSHLEIYINTNAVDTEYPVSFSGKTPFALTADTVLAIGNRMTNPLGGTYGTIDYLYTDGFSGKIKVQNARVGRIALTITVNKTTDF